jgi:hypothetical protein
VPLAKNVSALAAAQIHNAACRMVGFYVNSTNAGTLVIRDGDASGEVKSGTITPAVGWHDFPLSCSRGLSVTLAGTALNVTIFYEP